MAKATQLEIDKRIETVKGLILAGNDTGAICQSLAEKWSISDRQVFRYVSEARERLQARIDADREAMFAEHVAHRRDMRRRARQANDLRAELMIAQDEAKLWGLYPADRHEVTGPDGGPVTIRVTYDRA